MADSRSSSQQMFIQAAASPGASKHPHHQQQQQQQYQYGMLQGIPSPCPSNIITHTGPDFVKDNPGAYDLGELDQALFMYLEGDPTAIQKQGSGDRPPTLNIFPSRPMHFEASPRAMSRATSVSCGDSFDSESAKHTISHKRGPPQPEFDSQMSVKKSEPMEASDQMGRNLSTTSTEITLNEADKDTKHELNRKDPTSTSDPEGTKATDPKTLRRLAQNREAARKSRLRKKAYVQQLETSRMRLNQIEQELQRAKTQGIFVGASGFLNDQGQPNGTSPLSSEAAAFDMEYQRWLEEHYRHMCDLRAALQEHLSDSDLRLFVDNCVAHYSEILHIKSIAAKTDVFHLLSGMWKTPAERCFMWMGGFRPSDLLKILLPHIQPLTEQQYQCICSLQQSSLQAEEALSQGLEELQQSLMETIAGGSLSSQVNVANYMGQMAIAIGKLANLEFLIRQADNLRHQTLQQMHRILTTRQAAKCFLAIGEYFSRLRALSSLWSARPRE